MHNIVAVVLSLVVLGSTIPSGALALKGDRRPGRNWRGRSPAIKDERAKDALRLGLMVGGPLLTYTLADLIMGSTLSHFTYDQVARDFGSRLEETLGPNPPSISLYQGDVVSNSGVRFDFGAGQHLRFDEAIGSIKDGLNRDLDTLKVNASAASASLLALFTTVTQWRTVERALDALADKIMRPGQ